MQRLLIVADFLLLQDIGHPVDDVLIGNTFEVKPLRSGNDRQRDLVRLRRRQNEDDIFRRLLQRLQKRVEGTGREHVHLIDNVDFIVGLGRGITRFVADIPDFLHTVVAGGINFDDIVQASLGDGTARFAFVARLPVDAMMAVDGFRKNLGCTRLTRSPRPGKKVSMARFPLY